MGNGNAKTINPNWSSDHLLTPHGERDLGTPREVVMQHVLLTPHGEREHAASYGAEVPLHGS